MTASLLLPRLVVMRMNVDHHHVEAALHAPHLLFEPHHRVATCHPHVPLLLKLLAATLRCAGHHAHAQPGEVIPLLRLCAPCGLGHLLRGHHKHPLHLPVKYQPHHCRQRHHRFPQSHIQEKQTPRVGLHPSDCPALISMRFEFHIIAVLCFLLSVVPDYLLRLRPAVA